jgi:hypothetical protein
MHFNRTKSGGQATLFLALSFAMVGIGFSILAHVCGAHKRLLTSAKARSGQFFLGLSISRPPNAALKLEPQDGDALKAMEVVKRLKSSP